MSTPSITLAQILAYVWTLVGGGTALEVDGSARIVVVTLTAVAALAHFISDAIIRNGRARALAPGAPAAAPGPVQIPPVGYEPDPATVAALEGAPTHPGEVVA